MPIKLRGVMFGHVTEGERLGAAGAAGLTRFFAKPKTWRTATGEVGEMASSHFGVGRYS